MLFSLEFTKFPFLPTMTRNKYLLPFHYITIQPNTDIFSYLAKDFRENKNLTCENALLSLVNLYALVTKKRPTFY